MPSHAVIRFSSLGDVVLAGAVAKALGDCAFLTLPRYHALVRRFHGVVAALGPGDPLPAGARVVDLHHSWRSRRYRADARIDRQDLRRRLRVWLKTAPAEPLRVRQARAAGVEPASAPWLGPFARGEALVVVPGAAHATKRWGSWAALARRWDGPVRALGGPGDAAALAPLVGVAEVVMEEGFDRTLAALEGAAVVVGGDTGLVHLAAAGGLPVVGLFGPTTAADGFWSHPGEVVEHPLACRPCSRFGGPTCPVGDHLCLRGIGVEEVEAAARRAAGR